MISRMKAWLYKAVLLAMVIVPLAGTIFAIKLLWQRAVDWNDVALLVVLYIPISLGITIGFHRYLTHRGFTTNIVIKTLLVIFGSMAIEGDPIGWVANHRKHHALSDREGDPHSPLDGFFHAHVGWLFTAKQADEHTFARDLLEDKWLVVLNKTFVIWAVLTFLIPFAIGGWTGLLWGGLVRVFLTHHITWSVNSVCHTFGNRPFRVPDQSRNQWLVGLLALGEGWHNNHHAFPRSALHGLRWWQFDLSGLTIRLLARIKLARNVQRVTQAQMRKRNLRVVTEDVA